MTIKRSSSEYEIVLENRQLVFIFFGAVILCAVFFALGFLIGREQRDLGLRADSSKTTGPDAVEPPVKPAAKKGVPSPDGASGKAAAQEAIGKELSFYQAVEGKPPSSTTPAGTSGQGLKSEKPSPPPAATQASPAAGTPAPPTKAQPSSPTITFQIAALSKSVDAEALVRKLKEKGFQAFLVSPPADSGGDKLYRVQVGPFSDAAAADTAKGKLTSLGYKPILKK